MIFGRTLPEMLGIFACSLGLTLALELPLARLWHFSRRRMVFVLLVNVLTNPAAVFCASLGAWYFPHLPTVLLQLPLEAVVILAEGELYRRLRPPPPRPRLFSLAANGFSYAAGLLISFLFRFIYQ